MPKLISSDQRKLTIGEMLPQDMLGRIAYPYSNRDQWLRFQSFVDSCDSPARGVLLDLAQCYGNALSNPGVG